jgi:hypothetical protein
MDEARSLREDLVRRYGADTGQRVYDRMLAQGEGPFGPGGKYRRLHEDFAKAHGGPPLDKKKPRRPGGRRG